MWPRFRGLTRLSGVGVRAGGGLRLPRSFRFTKAGADRSAGRKGSGTQAFLVLRRKLRRSHFPPKRTVTAYRPPGGATTTSKSAPLTRRSSSWSGGMRSSGAMETAHSMPLSATSMP